MLDTKIIEEIKKLSSSERLALLEFTVSLLKEDLRRKKSEKKAESTSFISVAERIAQAGERAIEIGAPSLPVDFASNHDTYLYNRNPS